MSASILFSVSLGICLSASASGVLDWYQEKEDSVSSSSGAAGPVITQQSIVSPALGGAVVGTAAVPEGWSLSVQDLGLGTETITCPNAILLTVSSPDGACELKYLSRRAFVQSYTNLMGFEAVSADDNYDYSTFYHTLDYRDASDSCDLMAGILFEGVQSADCDVPLSAEDQAAVESMRAQVVSNSMALVDAENQMMGGSIRVSLIGADAGMAERVYSAGERKVAMAAAVSCRQEYVEFSNYGSSNSMSYSNYTYWDMLGVYGMSVDAQLLDPYMGVFNAFTAGTIVSKEYERMREMNAERLVAEFVKARNQQQTSSDAELQADFDTNAQETVGTGDTYDAMEGWDDVIRDVTDYTMSDGTHIKVSDDYDYVFEGDSGTIYAGNSPDGPAGTVQLDPTQIGG